MGSVKDLEVVKKPTKGKMGIARFHFSDRYSVFDWGEMPDLIDGKGEALCMMGAYCFERLEKEGIRTHYRGLVDRNGKTARFDELEQPSNVMEIDLVNVYRPKTATYEGKLRYDYGLYTSNLKNFLIPLEIIYRNGLPEGSSVFKRLEQGLMTIENLGLDHYPQAGEKLERPIFDVSTKLEDKDRYVTWEEAKGLAGLTYGEVVEIRELLLKINEMITELARKANLVNEDGKIELAFDPFRRLMVVDVVGTLDECRFTYNGLHVSKELARKFYRKTDWHKDVEEAKRKTETQGVLEWKTLCESKPLKLDPVLKTIISEMYMATSNELTSHEMFNAPCLEKVIEKYKDCTAAD
ncbi:MAG: phosphoribosylaminoimidazolesuccinocarboxamide synthase [Candidatus Bathyarchaeota archaeon]|nr:phosphoribosylaminoimidazolesuccinocarboxamide synthase [Candidatus Bathyarchaeota archaeon]MDH5787337.1 phosphoribosylaminoimidazolesuccinocarboxamide synthase [Candidatus Bathyarchaeota archaeon]